MTIITLLALAMLTAGILIGARSTAAHYRIASLIAADTRAALVDDAADMACDEVAS